MSKKLLVKVKYLMRTYLNISDVQRLFRLPCNSSFASNNFAIGGHQLVQDFLRNVASHVEMRVKSIFKRILGSSVISRFQKPEWRDCCCQLCSVSRVKLFLWNCCFDFGSFTEKLSFSSVKNNKTLKLHKFGQYLDLDIEVAWYWNLFWFLKPVAVAVACALAAN